MFQSKKGKYGKESANQNKEKVQEWGRVKFVPKVPKRSRQESFANDATPWKRFKDELEEKQREKDTSKTVDMNSVEAKEMLTKREQNYRRMLITEQSKQPTTWETFEDDKPAPEKNKTQKTKTDTLLKGVDLQNFDSKHLSFNQNNVFRKILTKGIMATGSSLGHHVKDMKRKSLKKKNKKQC